MIDSHAHLNDESYDDVDAVVASMKADDLSKIVVVGFDMPSSRRAVELAERYDDLYCAVGVHPDDCVGLSDDDINELVALCDRPKTVGFGEIGLDYHHDTDRDLQKEALVRQLKAVERTGLPAIFHLREAYLDMDKVLVEYGSCLKGGAVMHCFSGSKESAIKYLGMGMYISFSGAITFRNAVKCEEVIRAVPLDRMLIETDCPYLTPVPHRGEVNYPAYVAFTAERIAAVLDKPVELIKEVTEQNAYNVFKKMKRG